MGEIYLSSPLVFRFHGLKVIFNIFDSSIQADFLKIFRFCGLLANEYLGKTQTDNI